MNTWELGKVCNAFIPNAVPSGLVTGPALRAVERVSRKTGGLWVGGRLVANSREIRFSANVMNQSFHVGLEDVHIPLSEVSSVRIVVVTYRQGEFRFRCFSAKAIAANFSSHVTAP